jgi:hypothetical protein
MTVLRARRSGVLFPVGETDFSVIQNVHTGSGPHGTFCRGVSPLGYGGRCVKVTTHVHLVERLRMNGAVPLLPHIPSCSAEGNFTFSIFV